MSRWCVLIAREAGWGLSPCVLPARQFRAMAIGAMTDGANSELSRNQAGAGEARPVDREEGRSSGVGVGVAR
jgi:hypothetical protein